MLGSANSVFRPRYFFQLWYLMVFIKIIYYLSKYEAWISLECHLTVECYIGSYYVVQDCSITGFRKAHGTQNSLVVILEQWKRHFIRENMSQHYLWISQEAFDTISDDLLIAKLKAYGFSGEVLKLMKSHLKN